MSQQFTGKRCHKVRYATRKIAKAALRHLRKILRGEKKPTDVYHCNECTCWHLTSNSKKKVRSDWSRNHKNRRG